MSENPVRIELVNLRKQHDFLKEELLLKFGEQLIRGDFIRGEEVSIFEKNFSDINESSNCVSCGNGTDSLFVALKALDLKSGDEVIVPAMSWISTSEVVTLAGGRVVFVDVEPETLTIDPGLIEEKITSRTVGIIPVHLYGHPCRMLEIAFIAEKHGLWILEDCAQVHLAEVNVKKVCYFGVAGSFSFFPGKNLGALGDAGALTTNDPILANKMAMIARHGGLKKGVHIIEGMNSRMDTLQAAFLNVKIKYLEKWTRLRIKNADLYKELLSGLPIQLPTTIDDSKHVFHLFVIRSDNRDDLAHFLKLSGISTAINYPISLPFLPAYKYMNHQSADFPEAHDAQSRILSLPMCGSLESKEVEYISEKVRLFFK